MSKSYFVILFKVFTKGFFKSHSGLLIFFFVTFLSYFFYIEVLKDNLLSLEERNKNHLLLVLNIISSPLLAFMVVIMFMVYSWKSYVYVLKQMKISDNFFLYYSANALDKSTQYGSLFCLQMSIVSPILFYSLFSIAIGFIYGFYALPFAILTIVLIISAAIAFFYLKFLNNPIKNHEGSALIPYFRFLPKPLFSLFPFHVLFSSKIVFLVSKILSVGLSVVLFYLLKDFQNNQLKQIIGIVIGLSNAFLIFEAYHFEKSQFKSLLNLPQSTVQIYFNWIITITTLISPEIIGLLLFKSTSAIYILFIVVGILVAFRSVLLLNSVEMKQYLYFIFGFFIFSIISIQYHLLIEILILANLSTIYLIKTYYYKPEF